MKDQPILVRSIINCDCPEIKRLLDWIVPRYVESSDPVFNFACPNFQENDDYGEGFHLKDLDFEEDISTEEMPLEDSDQLPIEEHVCIEAHPDDFLVEYRALLQIGNVYKRVVLVGTYSFPVFPEPPNDHDDVFMESSDTDSGFDD